MERSGGNLDPALVKLFIRVMGVYPVGTLVTLENGEMGIAMAPNRDTRLMDRPRILDASAPLLKKLM